MQLRRKFYDFLVEFLVESEDGVVPVEVKAGNSATFDVSKLDFGNIQLRK